MGTLADELGHLKNHVMYPASRKQVVEACNNMSEAPEADRQWFANTLPEGNYRNPEEVLGALLKKV